MHLNATNFYGGPERQIIEHLLRLDKKEYVGCAASFIENNDTNEMLDKAASVGIESYGIPMRGPLDIKALSELTKLVKQKNVHLLCVHGYKACLMGLWAAKKNKIPVLAFSRGYTTENIKIRFYNWLERRALRKMDGIVAVSDGQLKRLERLGVKNPNSWVVHNAGKVNLLNPDELIEKKKIVFQAFNIPENAKLVVTAGRFSPEKGHEYLIEAVKILGEEGKNIYFLLCGDGPCQNDLERQANDLGVHKNCIFAGFRKDLDEIYQAMDLMVLPSLSEGLPNVVLEAFSWAKPVVATKVGGVPEVVQHKKNGLLVPAQKPDELAHAILECLNSPELARDYGEAGYEIVKEEFGFDKQNRNLENIYNELL